MRSLNIGKFIFSKKLKAIKVANDCKANLGFGLIEKISSVNPIKKNKKEIKDNSIIWLLN